MDLACFSVQPNRRIAGDTQAREGGGKLYEPEPLGRHAPKPDAAGAVGSTSMFLGGRRPMHDFAQNKLRSALIRLIGRGFVAAVFVAASVAGCSTVVTKHGTQLSEQDVSQVAQGMSQDQVRQVLGSPATVAAVGRGDAYYYISSTMQQSAFFKPTETDRQVLAIYFTQAGKVERVANYGMKDGKVFDFISRTTPSANTNDQGIVQQLFRNLGQRQLFGG
jgi:outer membrane protein assembly factor BamE (lipoprotein component of BamABCDE complex)